MRTPIAAVSLKLYFSLDETRQYCRALAEGSKKSQALQSHAVRAAIFPSFLAVRDAVEILADTPIMVGAQDACEISRGARTGEVSVLDIRDVGGSLVELGHAERRTIYGEPPEMIAAKTEQALAADLIPLICIGEQERMSASETAKLCAEQALEATGGGTDHEVWLGYEPYWAIGAASSAPADYVSEVCTLLRENVAADLPNASILYGGSAGPGLAQQLGTSIDGLFLGRFAHDPANFFKVVNELASTRVPE